MQGSLNKVAKDSMGAHNNLGGTMHIHDLPPERIDAACALFAQVFAVHITPEVWRWKYHGTALLGAINLVAEDEQGAMIGHAGAVIMAGEDQHGARPMVQICDVMVAAHQRGKSGGQAVYPALMRAMRAAVLARYPQAYAYGFPGQRPFLLGQRLGFYQRVYNIKEHRLSLVALPTVAWFSPSVRAMQWDKLAQHAIIIERLSRASRTTEPQIRRDFAYLQGRYAQHPNKSYRLLWLHGLWRRLGAWVVLAEGDSLRVVDGIGETSTPRALAALTQWAATQGFANLLHWFGQVDEGAGNDTGIVAMQFVLGDEPLRAPKFLPGDLDIF